MQTAMNLEDLLTEVIRQTKAKKDFVTSTRGNLHARNEDGAIKIVVLREGNKELEKFDVSESAHKQIAGRLDIPAKYYDRLRREYPDLICQNLNTLFNGENKRVLVRVLDNKVRAFLSDRYMSIDNNHVLEQTLPALNANFQNEILYSNVTSDRMDLKVLFTGDELKQDITEARGTARIVRPGFRLTNSEIGNGSLSCKAFFFDSYCKNGCVFGSSDAFEFSRNHVGGKLKSAIDFQVFSDETQELNKKAIIASISDMFKAIASPVFAQQMGDKLRAAANTDVVKQPVAAVEKIVNDFELRENERTSVLETFLRDGDFSKWGMASAVTEVANNVKICDGERINDIENIGGRILELSTKAWSRVVEAA